MKFRSKIDWWMHLTFLLCVVINIWVLIHFIASGGVIMLIMVLIFTPLNALVIIPIWFNTYYVISEDGLVIKCGLRKGLTIPYESIISAAGTKDPLASAALSLDRIELIYRHKTNKFSDTILISPIDRQEFYRQLGSKSEDIKITKETKPMERGYKIFMTIVLGMTGVVLFWSVVMMVVGEFDPIISVNEDGINITGMYGFHIRADQITEVVLIEASMRDIPGSSGMRTNGFDGFGQAEKGYFSSSELGAHIRFVQARTAPTIRIERLYQDIYISFRDSEKTRELFDELQNAGWLNGLD